MSITDYRNFDLLITRSGDRYRAFVVDAARRGCQHHASICPLTPRMWVPWAR